VIKNIFGKLPGEEDDKNKKRAKDDKDNDDDDSPAGRPAKLK